MCNVQQASVATVAFLKLEDPLAVATTQHKWQSRCNSPTKPNERFHHDEKLQQLHDGTAIKSVQADDHSLTAIN